MNADTFNTIKEIVYNNQDETLATLALYVSDGCGITLGEAVRAIEKAMLRITEMEFAGEAGENGVGAYDHAFNLVKDMIREGKGIVDCVKWLRERLDDTIYGLMQCKEIHDKARDEVRREKRSGEAVDLPLEHWGNTSASVCTCGACDKPYVLCIPVVLFDSDAEGVSICKDCMDDLYHLGELSTNGGEPW